MTEKKLKHIHPELNHNLQYPKMNSGTMSIRHNDPKNTIDDPENFCQ